MPEEEPPTTIEIRRGEESVEILAQQIEDLATAAADLLGSRLSRRAIVLLLQDKIGASYINKSQINAVLEALPQLHEYVDV